MLLPDPRCAEVQGCLQALPHPFDAGQLHNQRLLITGGTGFFGYWMLSLLDSLRQQGVSPSVCVLSRNPETFLAKAPYFKYQPWLEWVMGDVKSFPPGGRAEWMIHAATDTHAQAHQNPLGILDDVVLGTRNALNSATAMGVKRALYVSSGAVYGSQPANLPRIHETCTQACDATHPASAYGEAKRMAEQWCVQHGLRHGMTIPIARCFAFVGAGLPLQGHFAIGNFVADAVAKRTVTVNGDGTPLRSYLYGADMAIWLLTCLLRGQHGRAYNTGSDHAISIADLATQVNTSLDNPHGVRVTSIATDNTSRNRYLPDVKRARTELGLDTWTSLDQALRFTAQYAALNLA